MPAGDQPHATPPGAAGRGHPHRRGHPLWRTCDRAERCLNLALTLLLLVGSVLAAVYAGQAGYATGARQLHEQRAERHPVTARLTSVPEAAGGDPTRGVTHTARVRWTDGHGATRTGTAEVTGGAEKGGKTQIWLNRDGHPVAPPSPHQSAVITGWATGTFAVAAVVILAMSARLALHKAMNRHRYALWDAEWARVEPTWSGRPRG